MQIGAEPDIVLFFDCPEEEMIKRVLNRNQVGVFYIYISFCVLFILLLCPTMQINEVSCLGTSG